MPENWYHWQGDSLILDIRVQPRASRDEIAGVSDGRLRIRLTAPPVDGKANQRLRKFLSRQFSVAASRVELVSGSNSRNKRVCIRRPQQLPAGIAQPEM